MHLGTGYMSGCSALCLEGNEFHSTRHHTHNGTGVLLQKTLLTLTYKTRTFLRLQSALLVLSKQSDANVCSHKSNTQKIARPHDCVRTTTS